MKKEGTYEGQKVGTYTKHIGGRGVGSEGDIVLYREQEDGNLEVQTDLFSLDILKDFRKEDSENLMYASQPPIVNVPENCVEEVVKN